MKLKLDRWEEIAIKMFPGLSLTPGDFWNKQGIDGQMGEKTIQLKHDSRIAISGNIYHEIYEKSALNSSQEWRKSPGIASHYIFLTESNCAYYGYLISINDLALAELKQKMVLIYPNNGAATSMGFLLPLNQLKTNSVILAKANP